MAAYMKPSIVGYNATRGIIPLAATMGAPIFLSPVAPLAIVATAILSKKGNTIIDSTHTSALTARKDFSLA